MKVLPRGSGRISLWEFQVQLQEWEEPSLVRLLRWYCPMSWRGVIIEMWSLHIERLGMSFGLAQNATGCSLKLMPGQEIATACALHLNGFIESWKKEIY